jgi:hypothetical protein
LLTFAPGPEVLKDGRALDVDSSGHLYVYDADQDRVVILE